MDPIFLYAFIIGVLAIIQSIFGMGILVFGTPTLLLLGVDFASVLGWLLPSSMTLSLIQVMGEKREALPREEADRMAICGIAVVISLSLLLKLNLKASLDWWIGFTLLGAAAIRYWPALQARLALFLQKRQRAFVLIMGVVHGLTNMGGALLALYAGSTQTEKSRARGMIARYYLMFGLIQLFTLAILRPSALSWQGFAIAPLAALVYLGIGNVLFKRASAPGYELGVTAFIAAYGIVILAKTYL